MTKKEKVLAYLENEAPTPLLFDELCAVLSVPEQAHAELAAMLGELEQEYKIIKTKKNRYGAAAKMGLFTGRFAGNERGFGFVEMPGEDAQDLFIGADHVGSALNGDLVAAKIILPANGERRAEGEVVQVLEHANSYLVGTYEESDGFGFVVPDERRIAVDIFVRSHGRNGAKHDDKVVVEVTRWREGGHSPEGKIIEILGNKNEIGTDILSIIRRRHIRETFPEEVMAEVAKTSQTVSPQDIAERLDLRGMNIITIDGADSKDLDDAVSVEKHDDGCYRLGVHIADVSHYVRPGSALDREAFERGTSVYLVDRVIPMLPRELSNGICSLNPHMDRLTLSVFMTIDSEGKIVDHDIRKSVIRTAERMTYHDVTAILEEKNQELIVRYRKIVPMLKQMKKLSALLRKRRAGRGSIDFDFPEAKILLDENGKLVDIVRYEMTVSNHIIEDFMLACNETIAEHMYRRKMPLVYRVHETPDADKLTSFREFLAPFGLSLGRAEVPKPKAFQKLLKQIQGKKEERLISTVMLRSLMKARYSEENLGHFGLAAKYYCHFTSPIRRYPDLVVHRILSDMLDGRRPNKQKLAEFVAHAAEQSSEREIAAMEAERETDDLKMAEYMQEHVGEVFPGIISSVTAFGMFVELENTVEGLVRMVDLSDDYYLFDEKNRQLIGEHTKKTYKIGDAVEIVVARADVIGKQIDFVLNDGSAYHNRPAVRGAGKRAKDEKKPAGRKTKQSSGKKQGTKQGKKNTNAMRAFVRKKKKKKH